MSIEFVANLAPSEKALPVFLFRVLAGFRHPRRITSNQLSRLMTC